MQAQFLHASVVRQREFTCGACSARRTATVTGVGEGTATALNSPGTLERRAQEAAEKDVDDTLAVAACPACGARSEAGVRRWWWKNAVTPVLSPLGALGERGYFYWGINALAGTTPFTPPGGVHRSWMTESEVPCW